VRQGIVLLCAFAPLREILFFTSTPREGANLMQHFYTHGSSRIMTPARCAKFCELIAESHSQEEAAEAIGVSIRTIQRERKRDEDFDHEVRLALQKTPDPLKLMEQAARSHWRAAAWLLERQNPEEYARKPVNTTSPKKVATALRFMLESALEAVPEELRESVYKHLQGAMNEAFHNCFPTMGRWGAPKFPKLPVDTPHLDAQADKQWQTNVRIVHDRDEQGNIVLPPPVDPAEEAAFQAKCSELKRRWAAQRAAKLSPKTCEATPVACDTLDTGACRPDAEPHDPLDVSYEQAEELLEQRAQERERWERSQEFKRLYETLEKRERVLFPE
jgi:Trp operon repressor